MGVCAGALLLVLAGCGTLATQPAPHGGADGRCAPQDPCCTERLGDQTCDPQNATCFGIDNLGTTPKFADCLTGRLYWTGWTSLDDGLFVQMTRPLHHRVGPQTCAKVVITQASNVLGYISKPHTVPLGSCGDREARTNSISWFNVTGTNESLNLDFALLKDLDWKGSNYHVTLRPNQDGNFSNNRTYFEFKISPCNMTGFPPDKALWQTALLDTVAAALAFVWVTTAWACCGGIKQWQNAREERRIGSLYGVERAQGQTQDSLCPCLKTSRDELSAGLLDHQLEGTNALLSGTTPGRALRGSSADTAAVARFVAAKNASGGSTFRAKKKLERDLKAGSSTESQAASIQQAIKLAERDIVVERRRKQGEWRARFMASHRFTWPYYVWIEPDSTIVKVAGQRALEYMKFQWAIIRLLIGLSLPTLGLLVINLTGHWCENATKGEEITQVDQQWGIPLLDGGSDYNNTADYVCRMSSNNVQTRNGEQNKFLAHLIVALYFSVATYAVSKRDILGRTADQSQFIYIFEKLYLDLLVPKSFWWGAHCGTKGTSSYDDNGEANDGDDSESMITVTIAEPTGLVHTVQIGPSATVEELKEKMCKDTVASPQRLQLALDGHVLEEEYLSLQDYDLLTGSHLEAVTKTQSIGLTGPASPNLVRNEERDPSTPAVAPLTAVTRPASPDFVIAIGEAAQAEPEQVLVGGHDTVVALPPRPDAPATAVGVSRAASPDLTGPASPNLVRNEEGDPSTPAVAPLTAVSRPASPDSVIATEGAAQAEPEQALSLSPTVAEPFAPQTQGSTPQRIDLRSTGFEYGHNQQYSPSDTQSMRRRGRDATVDQKRVSPARNALLVRRISTKFEHLEDPRGNKGWLRNTLYKVFHRPEKWKVKDILIYSTGKHGLACFGCRECFKCNECTAFIVFESPEMPLDIIRRHRDATQKPWLVTVLVQPLTNICNFCAFVCCPNLRCLKESSDEMGLEMIFGRNKDTDKLGMPHWELQPGPTKEDLDARADSTGRWKNLNRPIWQLRLSTWFGRAVLFTGSLLIFSSTRLEGVISQHTSESSSLFFNFWAKYVPTLISFLVIVGILPTLIDLVVYLVEPHYLMSDAYRSVLNKNLVLLLVGSLVLPSLALKTLDDMDDKLSTFEHKASGVVEAIKYGHNPNDVCHDDLSSGDHSGTVSSSLWSTVRYPVEVMYDGFSSAFGGDVAGYFLRYMTHASLLGLGATLLLLPDKFYRTVSCLLRWKLERRMVWEFPLEYNYSIFCSTFAITLVYAIPHPPILFLGLLYAILRAFGDKYSLLFAHEGNLDSHFTDADEEGGADALDGEGVHASASYHAKALNETVHNFLLLTIVIFHVAIYGFLKNDPNGSERNFQYAEAMLISFFVSLAAYMRRMCAVRRTPAQDPVPEAVSPHTLSEMPVSGGFGYYVDKDTINMSGRLQLMDDGFTFK